MILTTTLLIVITVEIVVMFILSMLPFALEGLVVALVDSALLGLLSSPILWLLVIRPLKHVALNELAESESRHRSIIASMFDAHILIDDHGLIQSFNPAAERIYGYAAEDVIGHSVSLLMPEPHRSEYGGHLTKYWRTRQARIIRKQGVGQLVGQRANGEVFPIELLVSKLETNDGTRAHFSGVIRDITVAQVAEAEMQRLAAVVRFSVDAIDILDRKGCILYVNPAWEKLYGLTMDAVIGNWDHAQRQPDRKDKNLKAMIKATQLGKL
jgi:PAS domain S-box-containing protein